MNFLNEFISLHYSSILFVYLFTFSFWQNLSFIFLIYLFGNPIFKQLNKCMVQHLCFMPIIILGIRDSSLHKLFVSVSFGSRISTPYIITSLIYVLNILPITCGLSEPLLKSSLSILDSMANAGCLLLVKCALIVRSLLKIRPRYLIWFTTEITMLQIVIGPS